MARASSHLLRRRPLYRLPITRPQLHPLATLSGHGSLVNNIAFAPTGDLLFSVALNGEWSLWSLEEQAAIIRHTTGAAEGLGRRCCFSPDGSYIAVAGESGVTVWETQALRQLRWIPFRHITEPAVSVAFSSDSKHLAIAAGPNLAVVAVADNREITTLNIDSLAAPIDCAFSPEGQSLTVVDNLGGLYRFRRAGERYVEELYVRSGSFSMDRAFGPGGQLALVGLTVDGVQLWDLSNGTMRRVNRGIFTGCAISADGRLLAATRPADGLSLFRLSDNRCLVEIPPPFEFGIHCRCAFSPDGSTIAQTGEDGTIRLWQVDLDLP